MACVLCNLTISLSQYTIFASAIYIQATATSDTELVTDAAIILFIMEFDEKLFELIKTHASRWMDGVFRADKQEQEEEHQRWQEKQLHIWITFCSIVSIGEVQSMMNTL